MLLIFTILFLKIEIFEYKFYWAGLEAGFLKLKFEEFEKFYEINMKAETTGIAKKIYFLNDEVYSVVRKEDFQTLYYHKKIREKKIEREEMTIFFPEEKIFYYKNFNFFDFFCSDSLSVLFLIRFKKDIENPLKVYEKGKFYNVYLYEEENFSFYFNKKEIKVKKVKLERKDKKNANIEIYLKDNIPVSIYFYSNFGVLKAILQCY